MLSRRHLRIKVLQELYAYFQSREDDVRKGEKELLQNVEKLHDLYFFILQLFVEIAEYGAQKLQEGKQKKLPTPEDLNPNLRFVENRVIAQLSENAILRKELKNRKLNWAEEKNLIKKLYKAITETKEYEQYMNAPVSSYQADRKFLIWVFKKIIAPFDLLHFLYEEKSIFWVADLHVVHSMILKTLKMLEEEKGVSQPLLSLFKDEEDRKFMLELYRKTIINHQEYEKLIEGKTDNWEIERIATMDVILMQMAICEFLHFRSIPVKVTINEYIDISKEYSTPKSRGFINGVLDKLLAEFRREDKIVKTGRGLVQ